MIGTIVALLVLFAPCTLLGQQDSLVLPGPSTVDLQFISVEALMNNPEIKTAEFEMDVRQAQAKGAGILAAPQLHFMQEGMPGFHYNEAMFSRISLSQSIPFPTKIGLEETIASIEAEHAHHDHLEKINEVLARTRVAFYHLWFAQQSSILARESSRILLQYLTAVRTRYAVGQSSLQDLLKAEVELAQLNNDSASLRQDELSARAELASILNRLPEDTLGPAVVPEDVHLDANLDTLISYALANRPMLIHDSLYLQENEQKVSLARAAYIPDITLGLERITSPASGFAGWSVSAEVSLPFAPWSIGKASYGVEEQEAALNRSQSALKASQNMVRNMVKESYYKASAAKRQIDVYRTSILPIVRQSLDASLASYAAGQSDFLSLLDAYRMFVTSTKEYFMTRLQFETSVADLQRESGNQDAANLR